MKGGHSFEIGNNGAIIIATPESPTKTLKYTLDQGLTWHTVEISKDPIQVMSIQTEPTRTAKYFLVSGIITDRRHWEERGVVVAVDFANLNVRTCKNPNHPDESNSDYEKWTPSGTISGSCFMGHEATYIRRKREAQCFDDQQFTRLFSYSDCNCTEEDWECDVGYERTQEGLCIPSDKNMTQHNATVGYRKISGNTCLGEVSYSQAGSGSSLRFVLTTLGVIVTALALYCLRKRICQGKHSHQEGTNTNLDLSSNLNSHKKEDNQESEPKYYQKI